MLNIIRVIIKLWWTMIRKVEGIVLTETPYGDNSKIINLLTPDLGMIGIMCKGVKSLKSPLRTKTEKFSYGYYHIDYKENKLSKLIDIDIINIFRNIRSDLELISYTTYITELTYQIIKQNNDNNIYELYKNSLIKIDNQLNPLIITNILELKYLDYLGVGLNLHGCIKCGSVKNIVTIDPDAGGYICSNCYENQRILSKKTIIMLRRYYLIDINSITKTNISEDTVEEINYFLNKYYERYTGLYLKSKEFLKSIEKLK